RVRKGQGEAGIAKRTGERVPETTERDALAELDGEIDDRRSSEARPDKPDEETDREDEPGQAHGRVLNGDPDRSPLGGVGTGEVPENRDPELDRRGDRDQEED